SLLIALENTKANDECQDTANQSHAHRLRRGKHSVVDTQSKTVENIQHRIQTKQPVIARRNEVERIHDRAEIKPRGQENLHDVTDVSIEDVCCCEQERGPQREQDQVKNCDGDIDQCPVKRKA